MLKGSFGDTCRLALNLNSWFVLERHLTQGRSGRRPRVTSVKVLSRTEEVMKGKKTTKQVALVTFTPPADRVVSISFWLWRTKNRSWSTEECLETSSPNLFTCPQLCSYLTKYTLSLLSSSLTEISIYECLIVLPSISFPLGFSSSREYSWNRREGEALLELWIRHCVDIDGGHWSCGKDTPTQQNSWRVDPSPLSLLLPSSSSSRPPAAFLPVFSSKARVRHEEELNSTHLLQHTATNKR